MPLEGTQRHRFRMLAGEFIDFDYLRDFYSLGNPRENTRLLQALERFGSRPPLQEERISRYLVEKFLQKNRLVPFAWMGARLGLNRDCFKQVLPEIQKLLPRGSYVVFDELVDESLIEDCVTNLPGLRFRTFTDHEAFCSRLHEALSQELGIPPEVLHTNSLWCATDQWLAAHGDGGDYPRRYAQHFDCITCLPLSLAHATWLEFGKPMSLGPDRCSKLTYIGYYEELSVYNAGTGEPDDLERYRRALEAAPA